MKRKPSKVSTLPAPPGDATTDSFIVKGPIKVEPMTIKGFEVSFGRELRVVRTKTKEVVHRVPISSDKSDRQVENVMSGMLRNMADEFHVEDSADDK